MNRKLAALLGGAAVVVAGGWGAAPALASTTRATHLAAPARFTPPSLAILALQASTTTPQFALNNLGSGNQTNTTQSPTDWQIVSATGGYKLRPSGNPSLCEEQAGSNLMTEPCMAGNGKQVWTFSGTTSNATIVNHDTGQKIGVFNPNESRPAYVENSHSGFYIGFRLF